MTTATQNLRVFVVEDHSIMRTMLCEAIERQEGFILQGAAESAEEALDELQEGEVDIVLVDVSLPKMNGVELVRTLRKRAPHLNCLMVSGHVEQMYVDQAMKAGACGYVLKGRASDLEEALLQCKSKDTFLSEPLRNVLLSPANGQSE